MKKILLLKGSIFYFENVYAIMYSMSMIRRGFTLLEVSLFLAITGLLFIGIAVGVQNSLYQQKYNDAVQGFVEFLRTAYAGVTNVQGRGVDGGRTEQAIYGKLVTFGESTTANGEKNSKGIVYSYDVVGDLGGVEVSNTLDSLRLLKANVVTKSADGGVEPAGIVEEYRPRWNSEIESTTCNVEGCLFKGAVLIVRHPRSGTVYTFVKEGSTIEVNEALITAGEGGTVPNLLGDLAGFSVKQVDFCVNPDAEVVNGSRRDVRILENARNSSGIELIDLNNENNECMK